MLVKRIIEKIVFLRRKYVSSIFLTMLIVSYILWYVNKLDDTYTTNFLIRCTIEDEAFHVRCTAEGKGYRLFTLRYLGGIGKPRNMPLVPEDIEMIPSAINPGHYVINTLSLQNVISQRNADVKIISIENPREIILKEPPE
jgi:hypothetical protein